MKDVTWPPQVRVRHWDAESSDREQAWVAEPGGVGGVVPVCGEHRGVELCADKEARVLCGADGVPGRPSHVPSLLVSGANFKLAHAKF